jgi:hypothetical protein
MGMTISGTTVTGFQPLRILSASGASPNVIATSDYLANSSTLPASSAIICAVYATRGLEDLSAAQQCKGVYGREVAAEAVAGATAVTLTTNVGVSVGDYVQYAPLIGGTADPVIPIGTTVSSLSGTTIVNLSAGIITGKTLNISATLVFIKAANYIDATNKEYCVIPLNTAPPFAGTVLGLATTSANSNLIVKGFKFGRLELTIPNDKIASFSGVTSVGRYFPIGYGSDTYRALVV